MPKSKIYGGRDWTMKKVIILMSASIILGATFTVHAVGDAAEGKTKATGCMACHMLDGNSLFPDYPKLAGQHYDYLIKSMHAYKGGNRKTNEIMSPIAQQFFKNKSDMADLATYFSIQKSNNCQPDIDPEKVKAGKAKVEKSCTTICHGKNGNSEKSRYPKLAGQHQAYLINAMKAYKTGARKDPHMSSMAAFFVDEKTIEEFAAYFAAQKSDTCP
jgi:cytochrome c553